MKRGITLGIVISVILVLLFAGCAKPAPAPAETPEELLDRASGIASVKYDQVVSLPGEPAMVQKVWVKGNKMRSEMTIEGQTVVIITDKDAQVAYMYDPSQNVATKMDLRPQAVMSMMLTINTMSATEWAKFILATPELELVVVGSKTVDGKACLVVEITTKEGKVKGWFWKEYGLPIRIDLLGILMEWKNIEFVSIPDSMFKLPSGVKIQEQ